MKFGIAVFEKYDMVRFVFIPANKWAIRPGAVNHAVNRRIRGKNPPKAMMEFIAQPLLFTELFVPSGYFRTNNGGFLIN